MSPVIPSQKQLDRLSEGIQIIDFDWRYLYLNTTVAERTKTNRENLLGRTLMEIYPGIEDSELFKVLQLCMTDRKSKRIENSIVYDNGEIRWFDLIIEADPKGICVFSTEISALKVASEKLKEPDITNSAIEESGKVTNQIIPTAYTFHFEEKKNETDALIIANKELITQYEESLREVSDYKYALDESSILAITDQKGIIRHANENFCRISKYKLEELIGQDHRILNSGFHPKAFISNLWVTIANGKIWRGELKNKAKDGSIYWVDTTIVPFLNDQGKPYQYVAIRADITLRKNAEAEIGLLNEELELRVKQRTEDLESFSYSVSHDLRAPLRAVNGYARMLEEDYNPLFDNEGKRLLREVQNNAKKMGILIDDLLSFSRLGRKELNKSVINMTELTKLACTEVEQSASHHAEIKFGNLLPAMGDYSLLEHVMSNLISNAVKYSSKKEKPVIEITSKKEKGFIIFMIRDNGVGFDMRYAHKLFGVFQRLHSAEEFPGTGVGLAMVQRIIHKHKGRIWAEGKVGEGATFYFSLPESK